MSSDTILKAPNGERWSLDNLSTQKWLDGHAEGARLVSTWLLEMATAAFSSGNDEKALKLRAIAVEILTTVVPKMIARAREHEAKYPSMVPPKKRRTA